MRLSQRRGALLRRPGRRVTGTLRTHSSLLRGGVENFRSFLAARKRGGVEFELGPGFGGGSPQSLVFACGASAPCCLTIASEERETWAAGSLRDFGRRVEFSGASLELIRGLESEETTDGHVSKIHRASKECAPDRREAGRPQSSFEADVFGTRQEYNALSFGALK